MKTIREYIVCLILCLPLIGLHAQQNTDGSYFMHTVAKGQNLYSIAKMYNVTVEQIISLNPGSEQQINAGSTLKIPKANVSNSSEYNYHTIQPGETLYQLTRKYGVSVRDICDLNPGLSATNFKSGQVIAIPNNTSSKTSQAAPSTQPKDKRKKAWREMHKVDRDETMSSIAVKYGITVQELQAMNPELNGKKLRKGTFLFIPYSQREKEIEAEQMAATMTNEKLFKENRSSTRQLKSINAALILPFMTQSSTAGDDQHRMVEFYQGFLLAADSLKRQGVSLNLFTYDSQSSASHVKEIIGSPEFNNMDIIFGPVNQPIIKVLADYSKKKGTRLVVPFAPKIDEVFNNPHIYQVNTPQSYLYSEVYDHFIRTFGRSRVIFIDTDYADHEKAEFIKGLRQELLQNKQVIKDITVNTDLQTERILQQMDTLKHTVFVPLSADSKVLGRIIPQLAELQRTHPKVSFSLFGYPEWQTYTRDYVSKFYLLDTYFYSSFYTNNVFPASVHFSNNFRRWYGKDLANTYPKYGMLGFDIAYYFLKGLYQEGSGFDLEPDAVKVTPVQTGFKFERVNNWGGFINRKVFFIHFTRKYELIKHDFE